MAKKKPPQTPPPPIDDFDPDRELNEEIAPLEGDIFSDDAFADVKAEPGEGMTQLGATPEELPPVEVDDDLVEMAADEGEGATSIIKGSVDDALPDVQVEDDLVDVDAVVEDDFAEVAADDVGAGTTKLAVGRDEDVLPDIEETGAALLEDIDVDAALVESDAPLEADDALLDSADDDLIAGDDLIDADGVLVEDDSPHEAATAAGMPALDDDDPFSGVGEDVLAPAGAEEEGELVGAGVGADLGVDEPYFEDEIPAPKTHWFTWTLIGLNIIATLVAPYMIVMSFQKRQQYTYAVFQHDLAMLGLPSEEEQTRMTAARATQPGFKISKEEIKRIVTGRIGPISDEFEGVEEQIVTRISPDRLDKDILKQHFTVTDKDGKTEDLYLESGTELIRTVEDEIRRIQKTLIADIENAAQTALLAAPSADAKRSRIERMLHPLAMDIQQSEDLAKRIKEAQGKDLDKLFLEAAQRRMAFDFLLPLELFRPGDPNGGDVKGLFVEKFGDIAALPLDKVMERVKDRVQSTIDPKYKPAIHLGEEWGKIDRDTIEKRLSISFTLLDLAHLKKPNGELLYPKLLERIPLVMGLYDYSMACELFPGRILTMNERVLERIDIDRRGFQVPDQAGNLIRNKAFIDYYEDELQRIRFIQQDIFKAKIRLKDLQDQRARYETLLTERTKQRADVLAKIALARAKTAKDVAELRRFQDDLHRYQLELATSEEDLGRLNQEIQEKLGKRGGKQP